MKFSLIFDSSGDSVEFETISNKTADVLSYYVYKLNEQNLNRFQSLDSGRSVEQAIAKLHSCINQCNQFVYELLDGYIDIYSTDSYLDQSILNKLHADWVNSQALLYNIQEKRKKYMYSEQSNLIHDMFPDHIGCPPVRTILEKLGFKELYSDINKYLHQLENATLKSKFRTADQAWVEFENIFGTELLTNDIGHFSLSFHHPGRTLYNKFVCFDHGLKCDDENSFDQLLGFVEITLQPTQTIPLSMEYVNWCNTHNKTPSGQNFNIGNILDLSNRLTDYRKIIFQNSLQSNAFSIQLT